MKGALYGRKISRTVTYVDLKSDCHAKELNLRYRLYTQAEKQCARKVEQNLKKVFDLSSAESNSTFR